MTNLCAYLGMAQAIHEHLDEATSAIGKAAKAVEILALQSKTVLVSIMLPRQLLAEPISEAGYGSQWVGSVAHIIHASLLDLRRLAHLLGLATRTIIRVRSPNTGDRSAARWLDHAFGL